MATGIFDNAHLEIEDLYLLEAFQIAYLPGYVPECEFAGVLLTYPSIERFLRKRCPDVTAFLERIKEKHPSKPDARRLPDLEEKVVRGIDDLVGYNRCPEVYDAAPFHAWDFREVTSIVDLDDRVVFDVGSGTGRVALEAAQYARHVFAIEPVSRLREFIRNKAADLGLRNLFVGDGFLHSIPFPDDFADVLVTSHALGWRLQDELRELERVVKQGGYLVHCPGTAETPREEGQHRALTSPQWGYEFSRYQESDGWKRKYWKVVGPH